MNDVVKKFPYPEIKVDVDISMNDVVSAFVAKYEDNLFDRKKELTSQVDKLSKEHKQLEEDTLLQVDGSEFEEDDIQPFGLRSEVSEKKIDWTNKRVHFNITVTTQKRSSGGYYHNSLHVDRFKPIPAGLIKTHKKLTKNLSELRGQLSEVLEGIKSINRKERQVRGRIAIRKLEEQGFDSLMNDPELKALVELK